MRIAIDAMGGDHAPGEIIKGVMEARELLEAEDELVLIGAQATIEKQLAPQENGTVPIRVVDAPESIGMDESPVDALRKKRNSSIAVMARMAAQKEVDAVISAGNTGACVAAFQIRMRNLEGVTRPGIAVILPTLGGPVTMCDVGANIACKPVHLYQYAIMSTVYSRQMLGIESPRVGLMSIGEEDAKGNQLVKKTRDLLKNDSNINFIGNMEGRDIFDGACDVAICEGFVGNVILKLTEGMVGMLFKAIKHELIAESMELALKFKPIMTEIYKKYDYHEYGGAPLLGVDGTAFICHGSSKSRTIKNAILASKKYHMKKINHRITEYLKNSALRTNGE
ncbi:MAG TPA: phosphate acyltransferase PlsX [Anaerohalosphaeraceae bacterium]|jgi:glycerol-3-phosphate acyltransferase PlsX|nr:phosphate acyltransferase PlsX [Anaerohalosphaeraceae bacterium]HRT51565.1 phosphate acyltransferase PlsX [Anaerohalosphaeraceae bacterium]HRT87600.1 phosphate acyltransferase PlsX [Anaerohalosphaeraceae bacterium]